MHGHYLCVVSSSTFAFGTSCLFVASTHYRAEYKMFGEAKRVITAVNTSAPQEGNAVIVVT